MECTSLKLHYLTNCRMHHPCFDIGVCLKQEVYKTAKQALQIFVQINRRVQLQGYYLAIALARKTFGPDTSHIVFNYHLADPSMAGAAEYVWGMVIIGTHRLQSHLQLSEGVMT